MDKFIITTFGIPDTAAEVQGDNPLGKDYILSIGRSNRDFDFLVEVWKSPLLARHTLVILSDTWMPTTSLPKNIIWQNNIVGEASRVWFKYATACITPIDDGNIASGDTVLLTGMMHAKPTIITTPSTLAEMYILDGENGICVPKDADKAAERIATVLNSNEQLMLLGQAARKSYLQNFSRESMGRAIGEVLIRKMVVMTD